MRQRWAYSYNNIKNFTKLGGKQEELLGVGITVLATGGLNFPQMKPLGTFQSISFNGCNRNGDRLKNVNFSPRYIFAFSITVWIFITIRCLKKAIAYHIFLSLVFDHLERQVWMGISNDPFLFISKLLCIIIFLPKQVREGEWRRQCCRFGIILQVKGPQNAGSKIKAALPLLKWFGIIVFVYK